MKTKLFFIFTFIVTLCSCTNTNDIIIKDDNKKNLIDHTHKITQADAIKIAQCVKSHNNTRGIELIPEIQFITNNNETRSQHTANIDTLAYIINYQNNNGFVIVSADNRVYPVLGFSSTGSFSTSNEIAMSNFISNIQSHLESANSNSTYDVKASDFDECVIIEPKIKISLGQDEPWNKYVIEEHPNCPAGCVAIATALVISNSKVLLKYHGSNFRMTSIIKAIS